MPELEPAPVTAREPVALLDLVKLAIAAAGYFGLTVPEDTGLKVAIAIGALYAFVQATWFTRKAVTPVARADAHLSEALAKLEATHALADCREKNAYAEGVAVGELAVPTATVLEVGSGTSQSASTAVNDLGWVVAALKKQGAEPLAEPPPPAPPTARPEPKPPAGLYVPDGPGPPWAPTRVPPPPGLDG